MAARLRGVVVLIRDLRKAVAFYQQGARSG